MKVLNASQIRSWDQYTITHEPIASIDLMERAAMRCVEWLEENGWLFSSFKVFCGKGNNGGDGLAIARMLAEKGCHVSVHILEFGHKGTEDFQANLARLHQYPSIDVHYIQQENNFHTIKENDVIIDALFGSGLSRPLDGVTKKLVEHINNHECKVISIDMPSGMSVDQSSLGNTIVKASYTLSFQCYKLALLVAENSIYTGKVIILDIGLSPEFSDNVETRFAIINLQTAREIYQPRNRFSHKGNFGHSLIIAGGFGKIGAAYLSAKACLRSGAGLVTAYVPGCGYPVMQTSLPESMLLTDIDHSMITNIEADFDTYSSIGMGPGIGTSTETRMAILKAISQIKKNLVIDADGLNGLSMEKKLPAFPLNTILTPHPKEFERLFGESKNDFERIEKALSKSKELNCVVILKGHHTFIATSGGKGYFNSTGNPGMATAGSGDVLTGILTGLLGQYNDAVPASVLGVYLHGLAGDIAASAQSEEAIIAGDIIENLGEGFKHLKE